jgi:5'-3' exonuclease
LLAQFPLLEDALAAAGIATWPMVELEADDALAAAATAAARDPRVERVVICTPDKDLAQCVRGTRIVQMDRRRRIIRDEAGIVEKFGVPPVSIPDYLALVGDAADGYPGLSGWGARSAAAVLARFGHLESIPRDSREWTGVTSPSPPRWRIRWSGSAISRSSFANSRRFVWTFRSSNPSMSFSGTG